MGPKGSKRRQNVAPEPELTQEPPVTPAYSKRQRVSTQPFEAGMNPPTPPSTVRRPLSQPRQVSRQAAAAEAAEAPTSPLFEAEEVVRHEDSVEVEETELYPRKQRLQR